MRRSGFTLIELMIVVAIIGIVAGSAGLTGVEMLTRSRATLQREQALIALEYHATRVSTGTLADPTVAARLAAPLPDLQVTQEVSGALTIVRVSWRDPYGQAAHRELAVFSPPGRR